MKQQVVLAIQKVFEQHSQRRYAGEAITQLDHALQAAALAEQSGAGEALVVAALLHDIGHMVCEQDEEQASRGIDARHQLRGAVYLAKWFDPEVTEPIRLHVAAKAYLCATEEAYHDKLSAVSRRSLELQGGSMTTADAARFLSRPFSAEAVRLRRWDDDAKVVGRPTPGLEHFLEIVRRQVNAKADPA